MTSSSLIRLFTDRDKRYTITNLSNNDSNKILVTKICQSSLVAELFNRNSSRKNKLYLDPKNKIFIALIPSYSKKFINLFCCKMTMEKVYSKFSSYGLAIEGCFNVDPITMRPFIYQGYDIESANTIIDNNTNNPNNPIANDIYTMKLDQMPIDSGYLIIDNHQNVIITDLTKFKTFEPKGINVQYLEGKLLISDGKPFVPIDQMKNLLINNEVIDGSKVTIDYDKLKFRINNKEYPFDNLIKNTGPIKFVNKEYFEMQGFMVIGIDYENNLFIIYHKHIDYYNLILLLIESNCKDAIMICNNSNANIIWKEAGINKYNKTDFIGNPKIELSNVITFSS